MRCGNRAGVIGTLGINDVDFADPAQRLQAARKIVRFIANRDDHGQRESSRGAGARNFRLKPRFGCTHFVIEQYSMLAEGGVC